MFHAEVSSGTTLALFSPQALYFYRQHALILAIGCLDGAVRIYSSGILIHTENVPSSSISSNKKKQIVQQENIGSLLHVIQGSSTSVPTSIAIQTDSLNMAVGRTNGQIDIFHLPSNPSSSFTSLFNSYVR